MPRPLRQWTDFAPELAESILEFNSLGSYKVGPVPKAAAYIARNEVYRFRNAINRTMELAKEAVQLPPDGVADLHDILAGTIVHVEERPATSGQWYVIFSRTIWAMKGTTADDKLTPTSQDDLAGGIHPSSEAEANLQSFLTSEPPPS
jgi:hypothetical protein